jgi:peptide/nickel transport system substrate-binding protein
MQRRDVFRLAAGAAILAAPHIARAERERTLKYVPGVGLTLLDPVWSSARGTHIHACMVFDTLYGLDETMSPHPQMVEGHTVENDGTLWTLRLRDGLRFHDGTPVLARDAEASIRRFAARDGFGQALMVVTTELSAPDDRTLRFRLAKPFPHLPAVLAGSSFLVPAIMPERLAKTDPFRQVTEMVGSGPYRFLPAEFNAGERATYARFEEYVPCKGEPLSYTAGPKVTHFDRVEWRTLGDIATTIAALSQGEVDWVDSVPADLVPLLARNAGVTVEVKEPTGSIPLMRFNQLHPPFNNRDIRRALLGAVDQAEVMRAVAGADRSAWRDRVGLFSPGSALASEAGIETLGGPRDYDKVKHDLAAAGYRGERIVVLTVSDNAYFLSVAQVGVDQLRKAGLNLDVQTMDFTTMVRRRSSRETPEKGGWNVFFTFTDGLFSDNPATNIQLRGDGKSGLEGWAVSPKLEALHDAWLETADIDAQKRICEQMQLQMWQDVPYIPMGFWVRSAAHRRNLVDLPWGFAAFYGVRRV